MNLKKIRTEKGITIPKLVEQTGIPKRTVEDIQRRGDCLVSNAITTDCFSLSTIRPVTVCAFECTNSSNNNNVMSVVFFIVGYD